MYVRCVRESHSESGSPQLGHVVQHAHDDQTTHTDSGLHGEPAQADTTLLTHSTSTAEANMARWSERALPEGQEQCVAGVVEVLVAHSVVRMEEHGQPLLSEAQQNLEVEVCMHIHTYMHR